MAEAELAALQTILSYVDEVGAISRYDFATGDLDYGIGQRSYA
jgi:hypothetical protein